MVVISAIVVATSSTGSAQEAVLLLPLSCAIAEVDGTPVVTQEWISRQVEHANAIFEPARVQLSLLDSRPLDRRHARLEDRNDRHALGREMVRDVINCFVVGSLRDVDDPTVFRQGVHWRPRGIAGGHFVIVSAIAGQTVLAHELGHFFGNGHSETHDNIMSYNRGDNPPVFDESQLRRIEQRARHFIRTRELVMREQLVLPLALLHGVSRRRTPQH